MYTPEKIYRSLIYFTTRIVPSGVTVVDGQEYGIRVDDPTGQVPSIAVTMGTTDNAALELGSFGTEYPATFVINAQSRLQRDALKYIVRSGLYNNDIAVYSMFDQFTPASGAVVEQMIGLGDYYQARDMPSFDSDRERFFWNSVITVAINVFGL